MIKERLVRAKLIRRYKRFLADVELPSCEEVVVHCPNPGSMIGLAEPGTTVWLRPANDPKRALKYSWVISELSSALVCVDTQMANKVVFDALKEGLLSQLQGYQLLEREKQFAESRFDFRLSKHGESPDCLMEVKSVTLADGGKAMFPDAKTERGRKHLQCLIKAAQEGWRAVQFFCISRTDTFLFSPADHIDALYGRALREAALNDVELQAMTMDIAKDGDQFCYQMKESVPINLADLN